MRRDKRYRDKPLPRSDLDAIAKFRAEMVIYARLREGHSHEVATFMVFGETGQG